MNDQPLPSEVVASIKQKLKEIQCKVTEVGGLAGYVHEVVTAGEPYWLKLDAAFRSGRTDPVVTSGYSLLGSPNKQVEAIDIQSRSLLSGLKSFAGTISIYPYATASTASLSGSIADFDPKALERLRDSFNTHEEYARRLGSIDPSLGETFGGIKNTYFSGSSDSVRQALFESRQTFDHLFSVLAPDQEVMQQIWWCPEDPAKPNGVTRMQRMRFAAEKHVLDAGARDSLIKGAGHAIEVYNRLQKLHTRGPLDETRAKPAVLEMLSVIRAWIDAMSMPTA